MLNSDLRNAAVVQARTLSGRMANRCCRRSQRKPRTRGDRSCARRSTGALASSRHKSAAGRRRSHHSVRDGCAQSLGQTECLCVAVSAGCECRGGAREPTGGRSVTIEIFLLCVTPAPPSFRRVRPQQLIAQLPFASLKPNDGARGRGRPRPAFRSARRSGAGGPEPVSRTDLLHVLIAEGGVGRDAEGAHQLHRAQLRRIRLHGCAAGGYKRPPCPPPTHRFLRFNMGQRNDTHRDRLLEGSSVHGLQRTYRSLKQRGSARCAARRVGTPLSAREAAGGACDGP